MSMKNNSDNLKWYVLYTSSRAEKQVRERLLRQGVECWIPLHLAPRVWSDRVKVVEVPLFHSYVFVRCTERLLYSLSNVYGVSRIVHYDGKPAVVRPKEIEAIRDFLEQSANHRLLVGDEAEILVGAMKHVSGKVKRIGKSYLVLYIEPLRATVSVNLADVAPAERLK
jgi:transcription antitermination factor NusG